MNKVTKSKGTDLSTESDLEGWGEAPAVDADDIVIPKILAMQGLSQLVADGVAKYGEFRDSVDHKLIGSCDEPFEFIPLHMEKVWIVFKKVDGKETFDTIIPVTAENRTAALNETVQGVGIRRDLTYNFYVLLPGELKDGGAIPYLISFRRTSSKAGKVLATQMYMKNRAIGKSPAAKVMKLIGNKTKNDFGNFVVMDVTSGRDANADEQQVALDWYKTINKSKTKVDNSDFDGGTPGETEDLPF